MQPIIPTKILVVDDDDELRTSLQRNLAREGYTITLAADGNAGLRFAVNQPFDLLVLDVMLPGLNGLELCRSVRAIHPDVPIILLTARDTVAERVAGLELGADDYVIKPFAFEELLARIRVRLRRRAPGSQHELCFADVRLDTAAREAWRGPRRIVLTTTEYELLRLFLEHPRQVLSRDQIYERVWGYDFDGESKVIEVYVRYLREKLEAHNEPRLIHTLRGAGYVLKEES